LARYRPRPRQPGVAFNWAPSQRAAAMPGEVPPEGRGGVDVIDPLPSERVAAPSHWDPQLGAQVPEDERMRAYIAQAASDPHVHAAVREQAGSLAQQAQANYCASFTVYQDLLGKAPKMDTSMFGLKQLDWRRAFEYWNTVWVQAMLLHMAIYVVFLCLWSISTLGIFTFIGAILKAAPALILAVVSGHAGWYMVREQNRCCGNYGYLALGITYLMCAYFAFDAMADDGYELLKYIALLEILPLLYLEIACWKLGCGVAAREIGQQVRDQLQMRMTQQQMQMMSPRPVQELDLGRQVGPAPSYPMQSQGP